MAKTIEEINDKIKQKKAVVVTAEEMIGIVGEKGVYKAAKEVDVVTTATFGPMCSSGAVINIGHTTPRMKIQKAKVNNVPVGGGIAAVDLFIGATSVSEDDPLNKIHPGQFIYGGGHVIEDIIAGKNLNLEATGYGTDCYPKRELKTTINIKDLTNAILVNPRNCYQNYNIAINAYSDKSLYTYLGILLPKMINANYCSAGQLSPLLNDPFYRTIGVGTRIFLAGGDGYVFSQGTQHNPVVERTDRGVPKTGAGTIAVTGDMKYMSTNYIRGVSIIGYGISLSVGMGIPIPIIDEEMAYYTSVSDEDIYAPVVDYSQNYHQNIWEPLAYVSYAELRKGKISIGKKEIRTASLSSYHKAREIARILKAKIENDEFRLTSPVASFSGREDGKTVRINNQKG